MIKYEKLRWEKEFKSIEEAKKTPDKVISLNLGDKELGEFPMEILTFKNLQRLILFGNKITSIPKEIQNLQKLQHLDLYNNQIQEVPAEFCGLKNLQYLDLGNNQFADLPPQFADLRALKILFLYGNSFTKYPEIVSTLKNLTEFRLGKGLKILSKGNKVKEIPASIAQNTQLQELHFPDLPLKNLPNEISSLQNLKYLDLTHTRFKKIPSPLFQMPQLENVRLWDNGFAKKDKENLEKSLPKTKIHYEGHYEGNFWAIGTGIQQSRLTSAELSVLAGFRKDIIVFYTGIGGNISFDAKYKSAKMMIGANGLGFVATNLSLLYAWQEENAENKKSGLGICPEIGIGWNWWSITYSYTFGLGNQLDNFGHGIQARYIFRIF